MAQGGPMVYLGVGVGVGPPPGWTEKGGPKGRAEKGVPPHVCKDPWHPGENLNTFFL
jgi:hypothetical protein